MKKISIFLLLIVASVVLAACTEQTETPNSLIGQSTTGEKVEVVSVMDGDTMKVKYNGAEKKVRFLLIDAPEMYHKTLGEQPFGKEAQQLNRSIIDNAKTVTLEFDETGDKEDKYGRLLAYVYADGKSVQEQLISSGLVRVGYIYNDEAAHLAEYKALQAQAKSEKKGIWQYPGYVTERGFVKEKVVGWSAGKALPSEAKKATTEQTKDGEACAIKGNINAKGNKTYFLENHANYDRVNEEKLFCSESEAQRAGFQKAS